MNNFIRSSRYPGKWQTTPRFKTIGLRVWWQNQIE